MRKIKRRFRVKTFSRIAFYFAIFFLMCGCQKEVIKIEKPKEQSIHIEDKQENDDKKTIYITFDDGPNNGTTNLLEIAHERGVPITTFVIGQHVYGSKIQSRNFDKLKKDTLIELANHSFTHGKNQYFKFYKQPEKVVADFNRAKDSLKFKNNFTRMPGRNIWRMKDLDITDIRTSYVAANELQRNGYKVIGWDLEWKPNAKMKLKHHEIMLKKVDSMFINNLEKTSKHLVLLSHDQYLADKNSAQEMKLFIKKLQESNKFVFKKISEYPKINEVLN